MNKLILLIILFLFGCSSAKQTQSYQTIDIREPVTISNSYGLKPNFEKIYTGVNLDSFRIDTATILESVKIKIEIDTVINKSRVKIKYIEGVDTVIQLMHEVDTNYNNKLILLETHKEKTNASSNIVLYLLIAGVLLCVIMYYNNSK